MNVTIISADDPIRISLGGNIDQAQLATVEDPLVDTVGEDVYTRPVIIGMETVSTLDSTGVGWLLGCHKKFKSEGGRFVLHSLSPLANNVIRVLNMHLVFQIAESEEDALEKINNNSQGG